MNILQSRFERTPDSTVRVPVAIVGMSALFPGSGRLDGYYRDLLTGRDCIRDVPETYWLASDFYDQDPAAPDKTYAKRGGFLDPVAFDCLKFGILPAQLGSIDSSQLLVLVAAEQVFQNAGIDLAQIDRDRVSVILGSAGATELLVTMSARLQRPVWLKALRESGVEETLAQKVCDRIAAHYVPWTEATFPGLLGNVIAGRIANRFDLGGTNCVVDAACAGSLSALALGLDELYLGHSDLVITGGVDTLNDVLMYMCFSKTPALSKTGDCRPFSNDADGTLLGEGLGLIALKRLSDAERDGNRIYAVVRGLGSSSDGADTAIYAPKGAGQAKAIQRAYQRAGYDPTSVELIEAHGTGTHAGDRAELSGLKQVFQGAPAASCAIGSVKSQIGHTKAAAGAASLIKVALALHHKVLPPTIKVARPNPELDGGPFYLNTTARPWIAATNTPRRAGVSSFGFGGSNFHVALEEYAPLSLRDRIRVVPDELFLLGAPDATALARRAEDLRGRLSERAFAKLARGTQLEFNPGWGAAAAIIARDSADLDTQLARVSEHARAGRSANSASLRVRLSAVRPEPVAFLFPGQGSQYIGMGGDLALSFDAQRAVWDRARALFTKGSVHALVFPPTAFTNDEKRAQRARLTRTECAQPAIAVHSASLLLLAEDLGLRPDALYGHSFGELTALFAAGVWSEASFFSLAEHRGALMAAAAVSAPGAMTAVSAAPLRLAPWLVDGVLIANLNSPTQTVVSGDVDAIERFEQRLDAERVSFRRLNVGAAFHTPVMAPASERFLEAMDAHARKAPRFPVYSASTGAQHELDPDLIAARVAGALATPVRFAEGVENLYAAGIRTFVEVGPGSVLTALVGQTLSNRPHRAVPFDREGVHGVSQLWEALAELALAGHALRFETLWKDFELSEEAASEAKLAVLIGGSNHGKIYPPPGGSAALPPPNSQVESERENGGATPRVFAPAIVPGPRREPDTAWLEAFRAMQRETADAHRAFLDFGERALAVLEAASGAPPSAPIRTEQVGRSPNTALSPMAAAPMPPPPRFSAAPPPAPKPRSEAPEQEKTVVSVAPARVEAEPLDALLLAVVAERTGYPVDMLELEMDLERDLGIDSIKRVEILSAFQKRVPNLRPVTAAELGKLRTLADVLKALDGTAPAPTSTGESAIEAPPAPSRLVVAERVHRPRHASGFLTPGILAGPLEIAGAPDLGEALARELGLRGIAAHPVEVPTSERVLVLYGLEELADRPAAHAVNLRVFRLARDLAARFETEAGLFVTVVDSSSPVRAPLAGQAGLCNALAREWSRSCIRNIEVRRGDAGTLARQLSEELLEGGSEPEVRLDPLQGRSVPELVPCRHDAGPPPDGRPPFFVVSGGARGVTPETLAALVRTRRPRLLLLGRTARAPEPEFLRSLTTERELLDALRRSGTSSAIDDSPAALRGRVRTILGQREISRSIEALTRAGADVRYAACDVTNAAECVQAIRDARAAFGPVHGIIHAAGVLADKRIGEKLDGRWESVYATKVHGLENLLEATREDPLELICVFSSISGVEGNVGQADYALANRAMSSMARFAASNPECRVRAIHWGPFRGGMVDAAIAKHFESRGVALIEPASGARALADELATERTALEVVIVKDSISSEPRSFPLDCRVDATAFPMLEGHRVRGTVVLPFVFALELFARAAHARGLVPNVFRDARWLKGIPLESFGRDGTVLRVELSPRSGGFDAVLSDASGNPCYRAFVAREASVEVYPPSRLDSAAKPPSKGRTDPYDSILFHGPSFQAIERVTLTDSGANAALRSAVELGWSSTKHVLDCALLDGALQLALVWAHSRSRRSSLPVAIDELRWSRESDLAGGADCELEGVEMTSTGARSNIRLSDSDGRFLGALRGVELIYAERSLTSSLAAAEQ